MEQSTEILERIDDYLLGNLNPKAVEAFEADLAKDSSLATLYAQQKQVHQAMAINARRSLKTELKAIHQEVNVPEAKVRLLNWRPLLAVASVFLLGIVGWWMLESDGNSTEEIFADNYKAYEMGLALRNGPSESDPDISEAATLYNQQSYQAAIPILEKLMAEPGAKAQLALGLGIAKFETGATTEAIALFQSVIEKNNPLLVDEAHWYLGLLYLKENNIALAKNEFNVLAGNSSADHHAAAKEIIKLLK